MHKVIGLPFVTLRRLTVRLVQGANSGLFMGGKQVEDLAVKG